MSKSFDEIMKVLESKGEVPEEDAKKILAEHGALADDEKKQLAAAIRMKKALKGDKPGDGAKAEGGEVTMDDYLQALSTLDSTDASKEEKEKAEKVREKFESQ